MQMEVVEQAPDCCYHQRDQYHHPDGTFPGEALALSPQHDQVAEKDTDKIEGAHRNREQHQVENVRRGRDDRGRNDDNQDGVARVAQQKAGGENVQQCQQENQDWQFEHQAHAQRYVHEEVEILGDRDYRAHVVAHADSQQELQAESKGQEIGEEPASNKQSGGDQNKRQRPAAFFLVQAG